MKVLFLVVALCVAFAAASPLTELRQSLLGAKPGLPNVAEWRDLSSSQQQLKVALLVADGEHHWLAQSLAPQLVSLGHEVSLVLAGASTFDKVISENLANDLGVKVFFTPSVDQQGTSDKFTQSLAVYQLLQTLPAFDVIMASDISGTAYLSMKAKESGVHFENTSFVIRLISQEMQLDEVDFRTLPKLANDYMARQTLALANAVWTTSAAAVAQANKLSWKLPANVWLIPLPESRAASLLPSRSASKEHIDELVFVGELSREGGLDLFCDAVRNLRHSTPITFIGAPANETVVSLLRHNFPSAKIMTTESTSGVLSYLQSASRLPIITAATVLDISFDFAYLHIAALTSESFELRAVSVERAVVDALHRGVPAPTSAPVASHVSALWGSFVQQNRPVPAKAIVSGTPLVSVIIPTFNRARFLREAVDSVRAQTYENIQIVIVNDGSVERATVEYLHSLRSEPNVVVINQNNQYLGAARNNGAAAATGEYLVFLDDDNVALPEMVATLVAAAQHSGASVATSGYLKWDHQSSQLRVPLGPDPVSGMFGNVFGLPNFLIKASTFRTIRFTTDRLAWEDYEFHAKAALAKVSYAIVPEALFLYRQHDATTQMAATADEPAAMLRMLRAYASVLRKHSINVTEFAKKVLNLTGTTNKCQRNADGKTECSRQVVRRNTYTGEVEPEVCQELENASMMMA